MPTLLDERLDRLRQAQRDPEAMALVALDYLLDVQPAPRRREIRAAIEAAAVPHWFDVRMLAYLLNIPESAAQDVCNDLQTLPMIEPFADSGPNRFNVHETTRNALRKQLLSSDAARLRSLSARTLDVIGSGDQPQDVAERLYHRLTADPDEASTECEELFRGFPNTAHIAAQESVRIALEELEKNKMLEGRARAEALLLIGWIRYVRGEASQLRALAETALAVARGTTHLSLIARALCLLSDVEEAEGNSEPARRLIREGIGIFQELVQANGAAQGNKRDLTIAYSKLAVVLRLQGKLSQALSELHNSLQLLHDLQNRNSDEDLFVGFSAVQNQIGLILQQQGRLSESRVAFNESLQSAEELVSRDSENVGWQLRLSEAQAHVGDIAQEEGNINHALVFFRKSFAIADRNARADPSILMSQHHVAVAYSRIAGALQEQGDSTNALINYQNALNLYKRMLLINPSSTKWKYELALATECVGLVREAQHEGDQGLSAFRSALNLLKDLVAVDSLNIVWRSQLGSAYGTLGTALRHSNQLRLARLHLNESVAICEEIAERDPANTRFQRQLVAALFRLANLDRQTGNRTAAASLYDRHLEISRRLASIDPSNARALRDEAIALRSVAELSVERGHLDLAMDYLSQAVSILERVVSEHQDHNRWQADLLSTRAALRDLQQ